MTDEVDTSDTDEPKPQTLSERLMLEERALAREKLNLSLARREAQKAQEEAAAKEEAIKKAEKAIESRKRSMIEIYTEIGFNLGLHRRKIEPDGSWTPRTEQSSFFKQGGQKVSAILTEDILKAPGLICAITHPLSNFTFEALKDGTLIAEATAVGKTGDLLFLTDHFKSWENLLLTIRITEDLEAIVYEVSTSLDGQEEPKVRSTVTRADFERQEKPWPLFDKEPSVAQHGAGIFGASISHYKID